MQSLMLYRKANWPYGYRCWQKKHGLTWTVCLQRVCLWLRPSWRTRELLPVPFHWVLMNPTHF